MVQSGSRCRHQAERILDVAGYLPVDQCRVAARRLQIAVARLETLQEQRCVAPYAGDVVIGVGAHEMGIGQNEVLQVFVRERDFRHMAQDEVGIVDGRVARTPVGAFGFAAVECVVEHLVRRPRAAGSVGEGSCTVIAPVDHGCLERCAELMVHAVEGALGIAFVDPHVRSRDFAFLDDVHVAQARSGTR